MLKQTPEVVPEAKVAPLRVAKETGPDQPARRPDAKKRIGSNDRFLKIRDTLVEEGMKFKDATDKARKVYNKTKRPDEARVTHADLSRRLEENEQRRFESLTQLRLAKVFGKDW